MPFYSNEERRAAPAGYEPAYIDEMGNCHGPQCCGQEMKDAGGCSAGCCDYFKCDKCGHFAKIEWPD